MIRRSPCPLIALCLALGAATTLGLAWACAAWLTTDQIAGRLTSVEVEPGVWETTYVQSRFGHTRLNYVRGPARFDQQRGRIAPERDKSKRAPARSGAVIEEQFQQQTRAGWPCRAFGCERPGCVAIAMPGRFGYFHQSSKQGCPTTGGIELAADGAFVWVSLPYQPIWPGLIVNVGFFALLWWLLVQAPLVGRHWWRRRRGRCPACAYDLQHDLPAGCPECGWGRAAHP